MSDTPFTDRVDDELYKRDLEAVSTGELLIVKALLQLAHEVRYLREETRIDAGFLRDTLRDVR